MIKELTCIRCPLGCELKIELEGKIITSISGNTCPRGEDYAKNECINPVRTVTSTIKTANGTPVPVKTDKPIPKDKVFECMQIINSATVETPVKIGDIAIENVFGSNIIVTAEVD